MPEPESKSARPPMPLWLILVTLLGGAFLVKQGGQTTGEKDAVPPNMARMGEAQSAITPEDRMLAPLREFLGLPVTPSADLGKDTAALDQRIQSRVGLLEFLIVSVADPIETATNYRFDMQLDTLHKALGADGYVPDHYYLPWNPQDAGNWHRRIPGVLLYRRNGPSVNICTNPNDCTDVLLVYLVGETPTSGIHKEAFQNAVKQVQTLGELSPCGESSSKTTIRVVGPLFTGAADSLATAIRQAHEGGTTRAQFQVITGTAVSIDQQRFRTLAGSHADFHATVHSGAILKKALIDHVLERNWAEKVRIAWLTETGTGYGSSISLDRAAQFFQGDTIQGDSYTRVPDSATEEPAEPAPATQSAAAVGNEPKPRQAEIIEFRFPVNIAKVRSGYTESRRRERAGQTSLGPQTSRLPIPFEDINTARDVPPMQTPKVTAPTAELILDQILTTIRNEGIKYVGISSSDPRDPIFLAELIKEQCPDAQIMLVTSDLLHLHSEYRSIMHGTLVSSTHSLQPEAQGWCFPFGQNKNGNSQFVVLPSQTNYGLYNAILLLRGLERGQYRHVHSGRPHGGQHPDNLLVLSYSENSGWPSGLPIGFSMPFQKYGTGGISDFRPPVWISRISPNGICPITVRSTNVVDTPDGKDPFAYTLKLQVQEPTQKELLPVLRIHSRVPTSLTIATVLWLVSAAVYCAALWSPARIGNWAKVLAPAADHPPAFESLIFVFRAYVTGAFLYVLMMFGTLLYVFYLWVGVRGVSDLLSVSQSLLCYGVVTILAFFLLCDWGRALVRLAADLLVALQRALAALRGAPAADSAPSPSDLNWHLLAVRAIGLLTILVMVTLFVSASILQRRSWLQHPEDAFLWFNVTCDMWNGLSSAMTAQFLAFSLMILAYGMLLQMHLLSSQFTIVKPSLSQFTNPSDSERRIQQAEIRSTLLFPLLSRWRRNRPVVFDLLCVAAALLWLGFLGSTLQSPDYFALPVSFSTVLLLFTGGLWCIRLFKLIQILKSLSRQLEEFAKALKKRWPDSWHKIFELIPEKRVGLQELFWASRPAAQELDEARAEFLATQAAGGDLLRSEQRACAIEIELYARQFLHHIVRMGFGLALSASLLFITVQAFPFSQEPLLRLSSSVMLAAIGCVMAWYYLKFDRNELLSHVVGTDPKQISINWSLVQMVAPAFLLTVVALLSQTFPEIWQWARSVLEPMSRSSI